MLSRNKTVVLLAASSIYGIFILSNWSMDIVTAFLCILMGVFYICVALYTSDLLSPWGFLFVYQFLGYIDLTMVSLGISKGKGTYDGSVYTLSFMIMIIWSLAFSLGMWKTWRLTLQNSQDIQQVKKREYNGNNIHLSVIVIPCMALFLYSIFKAVRTSLSLGGLYQGMIGGGNAFADQGYLMVFLGLSGIVPPSYLYKRKYKLAICWMIAIAGGILLTGRRSLAITTAVIPFLVYWNTCVKKIKLKDVLILAIPVVAVILFIGGIRTSKEVGFSNMNTTNIILSNIAVLGKYNGYGTNIPALVDKLQSSIDFQYFNFALRGIEYFIPRSLWPNKPLVHSSEIVSNTIFFLGDTGRPVGPYGWAYFNFGLIGVFFSGIVTGQVARRFYMWAKNEGSLLSLSCYSLLILPVLEMFQPESQMKIVLYSCAFYGMYILSTKTKLR